MPTISKVPVAQTSNYPPFKYSLGITWQWQPEEMTKKKKCKKEKQFSEEALRTDEKRRDAKGKGETERYT